MDVVIFIDNMGGGGAERVVSHLAAHWHAEGREVAVVTLADAEADAYPLPAGVTRVGLGLVGNSRGAWSALRANARRVRGVRRALRTARAPVALGLLPESNVVLLLASLGLGMRAVVSERNFPPLESLERVWVTLRRHLYGLADAVVAQTDECARWLEGHTRARRVEVIPNAVVWPLPGTLPSVAPESLLGADERLLLAVGRLSSQKGFDLLLEAFAPLVAEFPGWKLVIVGERPATTHDEAHWRRLEARAARADLRDAVLLPGRIGNLPDWYARAELFVLSSRHEGFPNALLEAMAAGCAVLSTPCSAGPADIVEQDVDGVLAEAVSVEGLREGLRRLLADAGLRARLGREARAVRERFAPERVMVRWAEVLGLPEAPPRPAARGGGGGD